MFKKVADRDAFELPANRFSISLSNCCLIRRQSDQKMILMMKLLNFAC